MAQATCIVVVGMHRSGTSVVARGLAAAGVQLGQRLDGGAGGNAANAKGYFECDTVVEINDALLELLGCSWHELSDFSGGWLARPEVQSLAELAVSRLGEEFGGAPIWGFKDPRSARVLPFWKRVIAGLDCVARFVLVARNPLNTAASLARRDAFPYGKSLWLWLDHLRLAAAALLDEDTLVLDYERLMMDRQVQWARLQSFVGAGRHGQDSRDYVENFLDASLQHGQLNRGDLRGNPAVCPLMMEAYGQLLALGGDEIAWSTERNRSFWSRLDQAWKEQAALHAYVERNALPNLLLKPGHAPTHAASKALAAQLAAPQARSAAVAICVHIHYPELWDEIAALLAELRGAFALYVSMTDNAYEVLSASVRSKFAFAHVVRVENRGRDIAPFVQMLRVIQRNGHRYICKIHGKKSVHRAAGGYWRKAMLKQLLGRADTLGRVAYFFESRPDIGMVGPKGHFLPASGFWGGNLDSATALAARLGTAIPVEDFRFFAGSMFWCRIEALTALADSDLATDEFEDELGQIDGTLAHALERVFPLLVADAGLGCVETGAELDPDSFLIGQSTESGGLVYVEQLLGERSELGSAFREVESLAVQRLAQLEQVSAALALVERQSMQRLDTIGMQDRQLREVHAALQALERQSMQRLDTIGMQDRQLRELHAALQAIERQSIQRLGTIEAQDRQLREVHAALQSVEQQSLQRLKALEVQDRHVGELHVALESVTALALERLKEIELREAQWQQSRQEFEAREIQWQQARQDLLEQASQLRAEQARLELTVEDLRQHLDGMLRSWSWRCTRPLRAISSMLRRVFVSGSGA